jgi:hypothetical protein
VDSDALDRPHRSVLALAMTAVQRQIWWLGSFVLLLVATGGVFFWLPYRVSLLHVIVPVLLAYGWVRFVIVIWKPLYREQVSPGWSVALLFAAFGVFYMLMMVYKVVSGHFDL